MERGEPNAYHSDYLYGYSPSGRRVYDLKDGKCTECERWIAALKQEKRRFMQWLQERALPQLEVGDVIVINNASFIRDHRLKKSYPEQGVWLEEEVVPESPIALKPLCL